MAHNVVGLPKHLLMRGGDEKLLLPDSAGCATSSAPSPEDEGIAAPCRSQRLLVPAPIVMLRSTFLCSVAALVAACSGCAMFQRAPLATSNPVFIPVQQPEMAWERTIDAIHDFKFPIARESKLDGVIETDYVVGSSCFEPWNRDSVGLDSRLESTFQSIRRRALVRLTPAEGGYFVTVEAYKEQEDVRGPVANTAGGATFQIDQPLQRDLNLVVGQAAPSGWILLGRDPALEQAMLARIRTRCP